ncbi:MAG: alpha-L-rhamnosidase C-terminal domain-containing protein [Acidobacteriaceae bacterium]
MRLVKGVVSIVALIVAAIPAMAQMSMGNPANGATKIPDAKLDPARTLASSELESVLHKPLPEQYIWTTGPMGSRRARGHLAPRYFRRVFQITSVPAHATLYLAGPRRATIYVNGKEVGHYQLVPDGRMGIRVYERDVTRELHAGKNVLAIEAVRGPRAGNEAGDNVSRHLQHGDALAAMIVPAAREINATPLVMSDSHWKAMKGTAPQGWQDANFNDGSWPVAEDLGGIENSIDLFQANADAGMYAWPGYDGISPFLAHYSLDAMKVKNVYGGAGTVENAKALTGDNAAGLFTVMLPKKHVSLLNSPQMLLDFGREVNGRMELQSDSDAPAEVTVQYGESEEEAVNQPYLGIDPVYLPPHGTAYGPKSAFRYAIVRFVGGRDTQFKAIRLDGIMYPVKYQGSFDSSDPELNKMWTIGAYTAHLCMQDDIWDAPKRDRNRWMGDLDVSGRTIDDAFGDHFLMQDTLSRLIGPAPVKRHVNGIPGYSAFWVTGEKMYYLHTGSMKQLESIHTRLVQLLNYMEKDLNQQDLFSDLTRAWPFVDWSPEMNSYDAQTRMATQFEYYAAFKDGAYLLRVLHDDKNAQKFEEKADALKAAAQEHMLDAKGSFGDRWQPNAYAVISGVANKDQYAKIWRNSLSDVGHVKYNPYIITPYYNFYVVTAMAKIGHRRAALNWIRQYWGGMVQEGATSFWEGYDPTWYKGINFHASLQADNMSGYNVSLAHGWSSGVTPWLMTQILGIQATAGGFAKVNIRPDLLGLKWAKGGEPTPHGILNVSIRNDNGYVTKIELPPDVKARVSVPVPEAGTKVLVNGKPMASTPAEGGKRAVVMLSGQGSYTVRSR